MMANTPRLQDTAAHLTARLLAAIDQAETATIRYRDEHPGPCLNCEGQEPGDYDGYDSCYLHLADAAASPYGDAEFGLRRCAADRKIMALHGPKTTVGIHNQPTVLVCATCTPGIPGQPIGRGRLPWPCPTLFALAEGYGLTEETTDA